MASKSLLKQTSKKPKKEDKYKEISDIKKGHKFNVENKVVFVGLVTAYRGQECIVTKINTRKDVDYYKVKFDDDMELKDITVGFLKAPEEYEQWLLDQGNNSNEDNHNISDMERKILEAGLIPMLNEKSCMHQMMLYHRDCPSCSYEPTCVYHKKYLYDKIKFN